MALISIPQARAEDKYTYQSKFLKWMGYVDSIPILNSILAANASAVVASWRTHGKNDKKMAEILDSFVGNGKQTFKQMMFNTLYVAKVGGDCYFEIESNEDFNVENIVMLPPDNIRQEIKNGRIRKYEEIDGDEKWRPEEILHFAYNPVSASTHGRSVVQNMQNILTDYLQIMDTGSKIYENYAKPIKIWEIDTDDPATIDSWVERIKKLNNIPKADIVIPKETVTVTSSIISSGSLNPRDWQRVLLDNIILASRVPEISLGTGSANSEESAKIQFDGFRQMVRWDQKWMEETLKQQLFQLQYPDEIPGIRFSFANEPQDERFNRYLNAFTAVAGSTLPDNFKVTTMLIILQEMGLVDENA